jgi:1,4-dihydroxy-2-naphthoate octaprenyltransferase
MKTVSQGADGVILVQDIEGNETNWHNLIGGIGFATGVAYSFYTKTNFWKGLGIAIICSVTGSVVGHGIDHFIEGNKKRTI